jgi:hypothetical protein
LNDELHTLSILIDCLSNQLSTEVENRISADDTLNNLIVTERDERISVCNELNDLITNEISNRISSDEIHDLGLSTLSSQTTDLSLSLTNEVSVRVENETVLSSEINYISSELSTLNSDFVSTKIKLSSDVNWLFNKVSCVVNYMGELSLDDLSYDISSVSSIFTKNGKVAPLSCGWFYSVVATSDYYTVGGKKVGNGDFIKINKDVS